MFIPFMGNPTLFVEFVITIEDNDEVHDDSIHVSVHESDVNINNDAIDLDDLKTIVYLHKANLL